MQYKNYYAKFLAIYDECYADIVKMMRNKGVTRLEHQYAGMAMHGILACEEWKISPRGGVSFAEEVALQAREIAHALVEKMKEESK